MEFISTEGGVGGRVLLLREGCEMAVSLLHDKKMKEHCSPVVKF